MQNESWYVFIPYVYPHPQQWGTLPPKFAKKMICYEDNTCTLTISQPRLIHNNIITTNGGINPSKETRIMIWRQPHFHTSSCITFHTQIHIMIMDQVGLESLMISHLTIFVCKYSTISLITIFNYRHTCIIIIHNSLCMHPWLPIIISLYTLWPPTLIPYY